jgi:hypothetical protein
MEFKLIFQHILVEFLLRSFLELLRVSNLQNRHIQILLGLRSWKSGKKYCLRSKLAFSLLNIFKTSVSGFRISATIS